MEYPIWKKGKCGAFAPWRKENVALARRGMKRILLALELCEEIRSVKFYEQEITKETDV